MAHGLPIAATSKRLSEHRVGCPDLSSAQAGGGNERDPVRHVRVTRGSTSYRMSPMLGVVRSVRFLGRKMGSQPFNRKQNGSTHSAMSNTFLVRPVAPADLDQWQALWAGYNAFYGRTGATALAHDITQATWSRFFDPYEPVFALVAERDNQLLGLTHYLMHRSTTAIEPSIYLQDLFTTDEARGQGVGRALIEAVYANARTANIARVYWQTHESNMTAMRLYDKLAKKSGFIVYRHLF
jgi:GNAT superfamily N-acetyltransferase